MNSLNRLLNLTLATACLLTICRSANAYIDAGSGSYLLQILFASFLGMAFMFKNAFRTVKQSVVRRFHPNERDDSSRNG